jgi:hypothetical protein
MRGLMDESEHVSIEFSKDELEDLIGHLRTGQRLRPGHPRQQRLLAKLRGFGLSADQSEDEDETDEGSNTVCPLERDTPDDVSWLADWVHGRLHELTDGDEPAVFWKQVHLVRFLLGRLHDWLEESNYPTVAVSAFQAEALTAHIARYLEHIASCPSEPQEGSDAHDGRRSP